MGYDWGWVLSFAFSGPGLRVLLSFFGSSVSLIMTLGGKPLWQSRSLESINLFSQFFPLPISTVVPTICVKSLIQNKKLLLWNTKDPPAEQGGVVSDRPLLFCPLTLNTSLPTGSFFFSTCKTMQSFGFLQFLCRVPDCIALFLVHCTTRS